MKVFLQKRKNDYLNKETKANSELIIHTIGFLVVDF
jgi:hypothetical protein